MPRDRELLKHGLHRSVWLSGDGESVIKTFHSRGRWRRLTDGRRARREARTLARLAELGLPVPRLIGLESGEQGWELRSAFLRGARSLDAQLEGALTELAEQLAGADRLGRTIARFHARGFLHGDLHPGNLLETAEGAWFVIDVSQGRFAPAADEVAARLEFTELLGAVRERAPREWNLALWRGWAGTAAEPADFDELESAARRARHASVLRHADRWLRASSRVRELELAGSRWFVNARRSDAPSRLRELIAAGAQGDEADLPGVCVALGAEARDRWINAARALEHALPTPTPLALRADGTQAVFEGGDAAGARLLERTDEGANQLAQALADRGLWTPAPPLVEIDARRGLLLSPSQCLPRRFETPKAEPLNAWFPAPGTTTAELAG